MNCASLIGLAGILGVATASAPPAAEPAHPTIRHRVAGDRRPKGVLRRRPHAHP